MSTRSLGIRQEFWQLTLCDRSEWSLLGTTEPAEYGRFRKSRSLSTALMAWQQTAVGAHFSPPRFSARLKRKVFELPFDGSEFVPSVNKINLIQAHFCKAQCLAEISIFLWRESTTMGVHCSLAVME